MALVSIPVSAAIVEEPLPALSPEPSPELSPEPFLEHGAVNIPGDLNLPTPTGSAVVTLAVSRHSRILASFNTEKYALKKYFANRVKNSFVAPLPDNLRYQKIPVEWKVPATEIASFLEPENIFRLSTGASPMMQFESVGFPHIEKSGRAASAKYKSFRRLMKVRVSKSGLVQVVPEVACYGYSAERTAKRAARYEKQIVRLSRRYKVSPSLVKAVIAQESCFRQKVTSNAGAQGLMQLMPDTAKWLGVKDNFNSEQNLRGGIKYLSQMKKRFGSTRLALAAYNAGPGNVKRYKGIPPFKETRIYVQKVMGYYQSYVASTQHAAFIKRNPD